MIKLYRYRNYIHLKYDKKNFCIDKDNRPMNRELIKVHKGVDNKLHFRVMDRDRKLVKLNGFAVRAFMTDPNTKERIIDKFCDISVEKGILELSIREGEIFDVMPGYYDLHIVAEEDLVSGYDGDHIGTPFYSDHNDNITLKVEITEEGFASPAPTIEVTDFFHYGEKNEFSQMMLISKAIPASRIKNHIDPMHTIAIYLDQFTGTLEVYGSLDHEPDMNISNWFPIELSSIDNKLIFNNVSGLMSTTFKIQTLWIKFKIIPSSDNIGKIGKILVRS